MLCNLGIVHEALGQLVAARERHEAALAAITALGDRRSEGQFRGYLGLVYAKLGRIGEARDCLATGESLLRSGADPLSLAVLLCSRAQCECLGGDVAGAQHALAQAQEIARATEASAESELGRALATARGVVSAAVMGDVGTVLATGPT